MYFLFKTLIILNSVLLCGCYANWQDMDTITSKISCATPKDKVIEIARLNLIAHEWDQTHRILSMYKDSDALAVTFNKHDKLLNVVISKSDIKFLGLFRKQTTPNTFLTCKH